MRFFFHYNKPNKKMPIHFKKKCYIVKNVVCNVPTKTRWSERQPNVVMYGDCIDVIIDGDCAHIK